MIPFFDKFPDFPDITKPYPDNEEDGYEWSYSWCCYSN